MAASVAAPVAASTTDRTFLAMSSQPGDWIGQGQTYYLNSDMASFSITSFDGSFMRFWIRTPDYSEWWGLDIAAAPGQPLVEGTYTNAVRASFRGPGQPGLDVSGDGRGCNTLSGSFTVSRAVYGPGNTVEQFDATFTQICEGWMPPLTGEIRYDATPELTLGATIDATGSVTKHTAAVTVGGTVSCSIPVTVTVSGTVSQDVKKGQASAPFSVVVACGDTPVAWSATVVSTTGRSFAAGSATVSLTASATDSFSGQYAAVSAGRSVTLAQAR
jgi:hypothetical protein